MPNPGRTVANVQPPPRPAERGNARSLKHGTTSERALAPLRERHAAELRRDYPWLDARRLALAAGRLARLDLASAWLDEHGIVRDRTGRVFDLVDRVEKWSSRAEHTLDVLEAERRQREQRPRDLAMEMAALDAGDEDEAVDG